MSSLLRESRRLPILLTSYKIHASRTSQFLKSTSNVDSKFFIFLGNNTTQMGGDLLCWKIQFARKFIIDSKELKKNDGE